MGQSGLVSALVFVAIASPCTTLGQDRVSARRDVGAYLELVDLYRRGERDAAGSAVLRWGNEDLRGCVARLADTPQCAAPCVATSVLMHTELSVALRRGGRQDGVGFHLGLAEDLARHLAGARLALSHALLGQQDVAGAIATARDAFDPGGQAVAPTDGWVRLRDEGDVRYRALVRELRAEVAP